MTDSLRGTPTLIGFPYDASSSHIRGTAAAPPIIRAALHSPAGNRATESGADISDPAVLQDDGDVALGAPAEARRDIEAATRRLLKRGRRLIALGGDHSITYPIVRAVRARNPRLSILLFDAHPDLYPEFEGDRFSHACPFARILDEGLCDQLVMVGIRTMNATQAAVAARYGVQVIDMASWAGGGSARQRFTLTAPVYVSIDVDGFDPAFAPGVSHREPGGLSVREVLTALDQLTVPIAGADVVEFNPGQDPVGLTAPVCAKLVKQLAGRMTVA